MTHWNPLYAPSVDSECSPETHARAAELAAKIKDVCDLRQQLDQLRADLQSAPLEEFDGSDAAIDLPRRHLWILQSELKLRHELCDFDAFYRRELRQLCEAAYQHYGAEQKRLRKELVKLGYIDSPAPPIDQGGRRPGWIQPGFVLDHPTIHAARGRHEQLRAGADSTDYRQHNAAAVESITRELEAIRSRVQTAASL